MKTILLITLFALGLSVVISAQTMPEGADPAVWEKALKLQKKALIVDGHNDITTPMYDDGFDLSSDSRGKYHSEGTPYHSDFSRLRAGNITGVFFSIYVSAEYARKGGAMARAMDLIDTVYREAERHPDKMMMASSTDDIVKAHKQGKIAALMGIEGGHAIEDSLYALRDFYRLGVRYMTLTHNNTNHWADACCDEHLYEGLNDFGKKVVLEMNRLGMLVDISHVSDDTMRDVLQISTAPVIYSHSSSRKFSDHPRNVPDDILRLLAKNGGIIMINFYPGFLDQRYLDEDNARSKEFEKEIAEINEKFKDDRQARQKAMREFEAAHPIYNPPYTRIVDHIDHVRDVIGIDHIGIGSDYDGVPGLPEGMRGAEDHVLVTYELLRRGYSEKDILKILGGNFMRVFKKAEDVARIRTRQISGEGDQSKLNQ